MRAARFAVEGGAAAVAHTHGEAHGFGVQAASAADVEDLRKAVAMNAGRLMTEASGGITLDNIAAYRGAGANGFGIASSLYKPEMPAAQV